jgi:hypothetical protein
VREAATYAPIAFAIGILVGLAVSSRWRIVKRPKREREPDG